MQNYLHYTPTDHQKVDDLIAEIIAYTRDWAFKLPLPRKPPFFGRFRGGKVHVYFDKEGRAYSLDLIWDGGKDNPCRMLYWRNLADIHEAIKLALPCTDRF